MWYTEHIPIEGDNVKTITVHATWRSTHQIEVPDDFEDTGHLDDFDEEALEEITSQGAELTDWGVS
jgi:hypothetical protein